MPPAFFGQGNPPQMSRRIATVVCSKQGHKMVSLVTAEIVDPSTKLVVKKYSVLCEKCGLSEKQLQNFRALPPAALKKAEKEEEKHVSATA